MDLQVQIFISFILRMVLCRMEPAQPYWDSRRISWNMQYICG